MASPQFNNFCGRVCEYVRFSPDHAAITAELTAHLEDHAAALEERALFGVRYFFSLSLQPFFVGLRFPRCGPRLPAAVSLSAGRCCGIDGQERLPNAIRKTIPQNWEKTSRD